MLSYVLSWIEDSSVRGVLHSGRTINHRLNFFSDVLVVCPSSHRNAISNFVDSEPSSLNVVVHSFDQESTKGTCSTLRHINTSTGTSTTATSSSFPCDIIPPPSLKLESVLNKFRVDRSTGRLPPHQSLPRIPSAREGEGRTRRPTHGRRLNHLCLSYMKRSPALFCTSILLKTKAPNDEEFEIRMGSALEVSNVFQVQYLNS